MNRSFLLITLGIGFALIACSSSPDNTGEAPEDALTNARDACKSKACGTSCKVCAPGAKNCVETQEIKACDAQGRCSSAPVACAAGPVPYQPCGGKACGASCKVCDPANPNCSETADLKVCQTNGTCSSAAPACTPPATYQPCGGKTCGDTCKVCDPANPNCFETAVLKQCNAAGGCVSSPALCN